MRPDKPEGCLWQVCQKTITLRRRSRSSGFENDLPAEFKQELKSIFFRLQLKRVIDGLRAPG
jgi:hypothetical protein